MHNPSTIVHKTQPSRLALLAAGRYTDERGADKGFHTHSVWEVVYYVEGRMRCRVGDKLPEVWPGMVRVIPPGVVHGEIAQQPWSCYWVLLDGPEPAWWPQVTYDHIGGALGHVCRALAQEWQSTQPEREAMLSLLLRQLDILLRRSPSTHTVSSAEKRVHQFEQMLEDRFVRHITISDLAREMGVSYSYLRAQFVRLRGQTPMGRLQQLRAQLALALIRNSDHALEVIAEMCGYASASHLSRHIKRATGKSPGTFRTERRL